MVKKKNNKIKKKLLEIEELNTELQILKKKLSEKRKQLKVLQDNQLEDHIYSDEVIKSDYEDALMNGNISKAISFERYKVLYKKWMKGIIREKKYKLFSDKDIKKKRKELW